MNLKLLTLVGLTGQCMSEICVTPLHIRGYEHESSCLVFYVSFEGSDLFLMFKHRDFIESHLSSLICVCVLCVRGDVGHESVHTHGKPESSVFPLQ